MAVTAFFNRIDKYIVRAKLCQPLHVGGVEKANGEILVHPVSYTPFVQASGIAGVFRACYETLFKDQNGAMDLFGDGNDYSGRIRFTDGLIFGNKDQVKVELRPRIKINPNTGTSASAKGKGKDSASGQKFETEYVGAGLEIEFKIYIYCEQEKTEAEKEPADKERIEQVLALIHSGQIQFGGQKSNGCGAMKILSLQHYAFKMWEKQCRDQWKHEDTGDGITYEKKLEDLNKILEKKLYSARAYTLTLYAETEGSLLVKAIALKDIDISKAEETDNHEPDYVNMRNAEGFYIVPGSSVKGAVRAQFERIAGYMKNSRQEFDADQVIEEAFGRTGKKNETGTAGNVRFYDVLIGQIEGREKELISNRIHIDRFTGGVMNTGLYKERTVHGSLQIEAAVMRDRKGADTGRAERSCGMLILALRDLALGMYNLGSGYSVGRGFLRAEKLIIRASDGTESEIRYIHEKDDRIQMQVNDKAGIVAKCLEALKNVSGNNPEDLTGKEGA